MTIADETDIRAAVIAVIDEMTSAAETTDDLDLGVHTMRKGVKRLRAELRLWKTAMDPQAYRSEDEALSDIGAALAPARDAFVFGETLGALESSAGWDAAAAFIDKHHEAAIDELRRGPLGQSVAALRTLRERWLAGPPHPGQAAVEAGLMRSFRKGAAAYAEAAATGHAEAFHRWRKQVKYLRYQLEAVGGDPALIETLTELGVTLGFEHDQTVFIDFVDDNIDMLPDRRDRYVLIDRSEARRDELRALSLMTDVYADSPEEFVAAISA